MNDLAVLWRACRCSPRACLTCVRIWASRPAFALQTLDLVQHVVRVFGHSCSPRRRPHPKFHRPSLTCVNAARSARIVRLAVLLTRTQSKRACSQPPRTRCHLTHVLGGVPFSVTYNFDPTSFGKPIDHASLRATSHCARQSSRLIPLGSRRDWDLVRGRHAIPGAVSLPTHALDVAGYGVLSPLEHDVLVDVVGASPELLDDLDEFVGFVALGAGVVEEFFCAVR